MEFIKRHVGKIRTAEFALGAGAFFTAFAFGGDPPLLAIIVTLGALLICAGILAGDQSGLRKAISCGLVVAFFAAEGVGLYWHAHKSNIQFPKYAVYWVEWGPHNYRIGVVLKLFNKSAESKTVDGLLFQRTGWTLLQRGGMRMCGYIDYPDKLEKPLGDNQIPPAAFHYFKRILPMRFFVPEIKGSIPILVLRGTWRVDVDDSTFDIQPDFIVPIDHTITKQEWDNLADNGIEATKPIAIPDLVPPMTPIINQLLYSPDNAATVDNPYWAQTSVIRSDAGAMVFVRGSAALPVGEEWSALGSTYHEVWSDPKKLALYNAIYPPGPDGRPRPFGYFAGDGREMLGPSEKFTDAATTRAADIIDFHPPEEGDVQMWFCDSNVFQADAIQFERSKDRQ